MYQQDLNLFMQNMQNREHTKCHYTLKQMIFGVFSLSFSTLRVQKTNLQKIEFENSI